MQLSGRLRLTTLGDLLGAVLREKLTGTLELTEDKGPTAGNVHRLHLVQGHVVQVDTHETVQPIGEMLVRAGWFDAAHLVTYVDAARQSGVPLGKWLVDSGLVSTDAITEAVVRQLRTRLDRLFRVEDARVTFRLVQPRRRELDAPRWLEPSEYLIGRPRARDRKYGKDALAPGSTSAVDPQRQRDLALFGLKYDADDDAVRSAFRRLVRTYHPDRNPGATPFQLEAYRQRFIEMNAAYHRLVSVTRVAV
ncbi:MAG: DnaJ domain-containing protein [Polyangiaceae bacterium]